MLSLTLGLALAVSVALFDPPPAAATSVSSSAKKEFIASVVTPARKAQQKYGVPASVSIAQAIEATNWGTSAVVDKAKNYFGTRCSAAMTPSQFAKLADAQVGKPYVLGAEAAISNTDPAKFDCSELVQWLFGRSGNPITDLAASQYNVTKKVTGSPKVGDLVFLRNNPARSNGIGHVAVLTQKLSNGDWRIVEAKGRAYGVVRTTLSYWKKRKYYAGLRRYAKLVFAGSDGVTASAASTFQAGCVTISGTKYSKFDSITDSFAAHALAVVEDSAYSTARTVLTSVPTYVAQIARVQRPKDAAGYAATINKLINDYNLRAYDVVPFTLVLLSGDTGAKVTAAQQLLNGAGYAVKVTGKYDSATVSAVKKYQKAKKLTVDGEAGPITLGALSSTLKPGDKGARVSALHALLAANGYRTDAGSTFGATTGAAVKSFQSIAGREVTGTVDKNTWAALFMTLDPAPAPKITGTPKVGGKLTVATGTWAKSTSLAYQWYRAGKAIAGAAGSSYTATVADAGSALTVQVTGIKRLYTATKRASTATATIPLLKLTATPTPKISGKLEVGQTLTAVSSGWTPAPVSLAYQWYRGKTAIAGATKSTYAIVAADAGAALSVAVTGIKTGYAKVTRSSAATTTVPKLITAGKPTIKGAAAVGKTLTAVPGTWAPKGVAPGYQWYRGSVAIKGATKATYTPTSADAGAKLKVTVTGSLKGYTTTRATTAATGAVAKGTLTTKTLKINGTRKAGRSLTAIHGTWGPGSVSYSYQWYRGSAAIKGATHKSYKLTSADKGKTISVRLRATKAGYTTVEKKVSTKIAK